MKIGFVILVVSLIVLVVAGMVAYAWINQPELIEVIPHNGAENLAITSGVRIVFSRPMNLESVTSRISLEPSMDITFSWEGNALMIAPNQPWENGQTISLSLESGARAATWLAFPMQGESWSFRTSEGALVYLWPSEGMADIYSLNPTTGEVIQFTRGMGVLEFTVSSDGVRIYYSASNAGGGADLFMIDRMGVSEFDGTPYKIMKVLDCGTALCRSPSVSLDGKYLAYEYITPEMSGSFDTAQIRVLDLTTRHTVTVGQSMHETVQPIWSSIGWLAYYDRSMRAYEFFNPVTEERIQLSNQTGQVGAWSTDGEYFLAPEMFYSRTSSNSEMGTSHLLRHKLSSGASVDLSGENDVEDVEGIYSPNGDRIAFTRKYLDAENWSIGRQIWIMKADGTATYFITNEANYNHYDLAWSRDGQTLAYVRFNQEKLSEPPELWKINVDGSDPVQLVIGGYSPLWIP